MNRMIRRTFLLGDEKSQFPIRRVFAVRKRNPDPSLRCAGSVVDDHGHLHSLCI